MHDAASRGEARGASIHWRGHLLLFGPPRVATWSAATGLRLLAIFILLEWIVGPRLSILGWFHVPLPPVWLRVPVMLVVALALVRFGAKLEFPRIGLRPWREWSGTEKSYFAQVMVIAIVVFSMIYAQRLRVVFADPSVAAKVWTVFIPYFLWGFHQELVYRGILQGELVRRWGPPAGILVSNLLFTFGPLHAYHFSDAPPVWPMFAGIFAIGLFFGLLFWRSGNLWIVALAHGVGNMFIEGLSRR